MAENIKRYHDNHNLENYWNLLKSINSQFGKTSTRQNKNCWISKMKVKIELGEMDRDLKLYEHVLMSTLKGSTGYDKVSENLHTEVIKLFNDLVMTQRANTLEDSIDLFNRVWIGVGSVKELTRYRKRGLFYIHFIIFLIASVC